MTTPAPSTIPHLPRLMGVALVPVPPRVLEVALQRLVHAILQRHPNLLDRLERRAVRRIGIAPIDLPFAVILEPQDNLLTLRVVRQLDPGIVHARIRGPILALIGLVDGSYDGDALFFSRDITIEGDIQSVLALRNAIDDAQIDLWHAATGWAGPLSDPLQRAVRLCLRGAGELLARRQPVAR